MRLRPLLSLASVLITVSGPISAKEWKAVKIATEGAYAPWNFTEGSGKLNGYDIDVSNDLCKRMKVECEITAQNWDGIIPSLNAGKYDAIVAAMVITPKRREAVDFTIPYAIGPRSFIVPKSSPLAKIASQETVLSLTADADKVTEAVKALSPMLKGKSIGVQSATTHVQFLETYMKGLVTVREYKSAEAMILDLSSGRIDAALDGIAFLGGTLSTPEGQELQLVGPRFTGGLFGEGSAIAVRKGDPELREKFNEALAAARGDGTLRNLSLKWFKLDISPKN